MSEPVPAPVTDPVVIEAIEAEFMLAVYEARRRARLQELGLMPPPRPNPAALRLRRRALAGDSEPGVPRPSPVAP